LVAARAVGGTLIDGKFDREDTDDSLPAGCSVSNRKEGDGKLRSVFNNMDPDDVKNSGRGNKEYSQVCRANRQHEPFLFGKDGEYPDGDIDQYRFPTFKTKLDFPELDGKKVEEAGKEARDVHGQIRNSNNGAFNYFSFKYLEELFEECVKEVSEKIIDEVEEWKEPKDLESLLDDYYEDFFGRCVGRNFFGLMRQGIELVYGDRASPGYICGVKDAIKRGSGDMPGRCCLDAPFELEGDEWGLKV